MEEQRACSAWTDFVFHPKICLLIFGYETLRMRLKGDICVSSRHCLLTTLRCAPSHTANTVGH